MKKSTIRGRGRSHCSSGGHLCLAVFGTPLALSSLEPTVAWAQSSSDTEPSQGATGVVAAAPSSQDVREPEGELDPTGGPYTSPTLLFIPAAAVPVWTVRVITSLDVQGPTAADRLANGTSLGFQPGLGGEVGLPLGFTIGAGTNWVGGDTSPTPISGGLSPYVQARYQVLGERDGQGFLLGTSLTYKFVGFQGDPGEMELAISAQYRKRLYELGLQGVIGKDFATTDADSEFHAYALFRIIPELGVGAAAQLRVAIVSQPGETTYDLVSGALASLTLGRWQVGALAGESTIGLNQRQVGALGEMFATARF